MARDSQKLTEAHQKLIAQGGWTGLLFVPGLLDLEAGGDDDAGGRLTAKTPGAEGLIMEKRRERRGKISQ